MTNLKISKFKITNFRNLSLDIVEFHPNLNFLYGDNGNGKTNFLEAIYYALTGKSFRKNVNFPQIISFDSDTYSLMLNFILEAKEQNILMNYSGRVGSKDSLWSKNNEIISKKKAVYPAVFIASHHPYEFYSAPKFRREWFDHSISLINSNYEKENNRYLKFLKNRNRLLSTGKTLKKSDFEQINAIDKNLSQIIPGLISSKIEFIQKIKNYTQDLFFEIFQESHKIELFLDSKFKDLSETFVYNNLQLNIPKDLILGYTSEGVHKDDYELLINGLDVLDFASLGQQKVIYMSLLFAAIKVLRDEKKIDPIILVDDLSNEIDNKRWNNLIEFLIKSDFQVIITSANRLFLQTLSPHTKCKSFEIVSGKIISTTTI